MPCTTVAPDPRCGSSARTCSTTGRTRGHSGLSASDAGRTCTPLSSLPHPLIRKAQAWFASDPAADSYHERIQCAQQLGLLEVKSGQWRGAVWQDPDTGVRWLCAAGLAKGGHEDSDDFYVALKALFDSGDAARLLPSAEDTMLLKRETAAALLTSWELGIQSQALTALDRVADGGTARFEITHPAKGEPVAAIALTVTTEVGDEYDIEVCIVDIDLNDKYRGSQLGWQLTTRVLISIWPPVQGWDRYQDTYSTMVEPGDLRQRANDLARTVADRNLVSPLPGSVSHYGHTRHLADHTVNGTAIRALCGVFFVPATDAAAAQRRTPLHRARATHLRAAGVVPGSPSR
jgi:hypothetical protein